MSHDALVLVVVAGAAVVALWGHVRFPGALPARRGVLLAHLIASLVALQVAPAAMVLIPGASESALPATVALLGVFFPALVYVFLTAIWIIRTVQGVLARG